MFGKIVVGVTPAASAREAARHAAGLARAVGAELHLVSAYSQGSVDRLGSSLVVTADDPRERRHTEQFLSSLPEARLSRARTHALPGSPAREILRVAHEVEADLIVVGDKGMHGVRRFFGSVPNDVSHAAPCSVLVVKTT
jgi:nucleotide-binding universal stress UspA family protein